jgi:hypothetical protein
MSKGWFTGKKLDDYIDAIDENDTEDEREYKLARRIINGTDKAELIATYASLLEKGLKAGGYVRLADPHQSPSSDRTSDWWEDGVDASELPKIDPTASAGLIAGIFNLLLAFFKGKK